MKFYFTTLLLFIVSVVGAQQISNENIVRQMFHQLENENDVKSVLSLEETDSSNVSRAYFGASKAMMAQYSFSPIKKYKLFIAGTKQIEQSIVIHKEVENIYLRLLIQLNSPRFLGYSDNIQNDLYYIYDNIKKDELPNSWKIIILEKVLLFESEEYDFLALKNTLSNYKIACQNH